LPGGKSPWFKYRCLAVGNGSGRCGGFDWAENYLFMVSEMVGVGLAVEIVAESFHFGEGVLIVGAVGGGDAVVKTVEGFAGAAEFGEGLGGHLIGGNVVGAVLDEGGELGEGGVGVALADVLHGEAVASKGVGGVGCEDFSKGCDLIHGLMVRCEG
jgi:hypothetical protein